MYKGISCSEKHGHATRRGVGLGWCKGGGIIFSKRMVAFYMRII
jgi:hypothetical protein